MLTTAYCLVVGLWLRLDFVSGWLLVFVLGSFGVTEESGQTRGPCTATDR